MGLSLSAEFMVPANYNSEADKRAAERVMEFEVRNGHFFGMIYILGILITLGS